jgi:flagellin-like hook-associated protein FlgL
MFVGNIANLVINDENIGNVNIKTRKDYQVVLVDKINEKTSKHGVVATLLPNNKLQLESKDGRGISIRADANLKVLNIGSDNLKNYGKLTLTSYDSSPIKLNNSTLVGFDKRSSSIISLNKFSSGRLNKDDIKAVGINTLNSSNGTLDLTNKDFSKNLLSIVENLSKTLQTQKKGISFIQNSVKNARDVLIQESKGSKEGLSNVEDINYAEEILNNTKYKILSQSAAYSVVDSLNFNKKIFDIIFDSFKKYN